MMYSLWTMPLGNARVVTYSNRTSRLKRASWADDSDR
jgi:hypothetical protein